MNIVETLVSQLGVSNDQASGGMGLILKMAQSKLASGEFDSIAKIIPDATALMGAAPSTEGASGGLGGMVGSALSAVGVDGLGDIAKLASGFDKLGLDKDMIAKFAPVVMGFFQNNGGEGVAESLKKLF